jgi:hypothetical protein
MTLVSDGKKMLTLKEVRSENDVCILLCYNLKGILQFNQHKHTSIIYLYILSHFRTNSTRFMTNFLWRNSSFVREYSFTCWCDDKIYIRKVPDKIPGTQRKQYSSHSFIKYGKKTLLLCEKNF